MGRTIAIARRYNRWNQYINIEGVYETVEKATEYITSEWPWLKFDENLWRYVDETDGTYFVIDEWTVR